jgi:hypothetical protein
MVHDRVPKPGEILRYQEVADVLSEEKVRAYVQRIQGAWARRLPDHLCPFRFEGGKMLIHHDDGSWQRSRHEDAAWYSSLVEDDALERNYAWYQEKVIPDHPTIHAVVFIESKDGKRRARPLETTIENENASALARPVTNGVDPAARDGLPASGNEAAEKG